ncbi:MAG: type II toxin-antitoxin system RelE/ParE family toxin [Candidatus Symbiothrix sp.]|jgi:plasmid stabilization system protein ParE|nr:type II toxin-antitoxin system RelE/ParE family toxin [Candidatus Symbiothrix sp.]
MAGGKSIIIPTNTLVKLVITQRFIDNLTKALHYSLENFGGKVMLGFLDEINKELLKLLSFPAANPLNNFLENTEQKTYRNIILKKYPYIILYCVKQNSIIVFNIIHSNRSPKYRKETI